MQLNVLLRGQSNAGLLVRSPDYGKIATMAEQLLGFNGTTNTINLLEKDSSPTNDNTVVGGTAFIGDWIQPVNGNWQNGWTNVSLENGLLNYINEMTPAQKANPTAVVWLQNENDSTNPNLTTAEWMSGVSYEAQQVRQALGQSAATTPYVFVNAIPFGDNLIPATNQAIKQGMELLTANPAFHATVGAQSNDSNMDYGQTGTYGGPHMGIDDSNQVDLRLARVIAQEFAQYALPGSPVAAGTVDAYGPEAFAARATGTGTDQVLVTMGLNNASLSTTLSTDAANGVGWSIIDNGQTLNATAAQVTDGNHVLLTFGSAVPTDAGATLFYTYGYGRLATGSTDPGLNNAIYDTQQMPIWGPASGVHIDPASPAGSFTEQNLVTGGIATLAGTTSSMSGYTGEFIAIGPDTVQVTANTPSVFMVAGQGQDVLMASSGNNLLDAGQNTALLIGGSGLDHFVIDSVGLSTWDAIANFHAGDAAVIWGATLGASALTWGETTTNQAVLTLTGGGVGSSGIGFVNTTAAEAQKFIVGGGSAGGMNYITISHP